MRPRAELSTRIRLFSRILASVLLAAGLEAVTLPAAPSSQDKSEPVERKKPVKPELESGSPQDTREHQKGYTIGVNVDLVVVHTTVQDKSGHFVSGLKKEDFRIYEDGVEQTITLFSQEDVPVTLGIVIDTSGSMRNKIDNVNRAALAFIKASNPQDEVFLIGFNDQVELLEDYTSDIEAITDSLDNIIVAGGTALYDAIHLAVEKAHKGIKPKKAIIVITDGEDRDSYYKLEEMTAKVQESDVQVYSVGFLNAIPEKGLFGRWSKSVPEKAHDALQLISEDTGARAFFPQKVSEINQIVSEVAYELRNQYSIGYISSNTARDGTYRRIKVEIDPAKAAGNHLRYRRGYTAPKVDTN
jgi:Ca-activated chloride channel family protein